VTFFIDYLQENDGLSSYFRLPAKSTISNMGTVYSFTYFIAIKTALVSLEKLENDGQGK
jgi:hypothetical protein